MESAGLSYLKESAKLHETTTPQSVDHLLGFVLCLASSFQSDAQHFLGLIL